MEAKSRTDRKIIIASSILFVLCLLIILLPFNALINTFFSEKLGIGLLKFWKEIIFVILIILMGVSGKWKKAPRKGLFWISLAYAALVFINALRLGVDLNFLRIIRLELLPVIGLLVMTYIIKLVDKDDRRKLTSLFLGSGFVALLMGLLVFWLYGGEGLTMFGYRPDWSTFYAGEALAYCQKIENSDVCRFQGFMSGPNQLGVYLVLMMVVGLDFLKKWKLKALLSIVCLALLYLTFSRSSMIAGIIVLIGYIGWENRDFILKNKLKFLGAGIVGALLSLLMIGDNIYEFLNRPESNSQRLEFLSNGWNLWKENFIFGNGAGTAGPSSRFLEGRELITENWFLQVGAQFGLIGLGLFVGWYGLVMKKLYENKSLLGFLLMTALLVPLNLLHTFEASAFVYGLIFLLSTQLDEIEN